MGKGRGRGALVVVVVGENGVINRMDGTDLLLFLLLRVAFSLGTPIMYGFAVV